MWKMKSEMLDKFPVQLVHTLMQHIYYTSIMQLPSNSL